MSRVNHQLLNEQAGSLIVDGVVEYQRPGQTAHS
jgi:hypothetical protein